MRFGIGIQRPGFNVFAYGPSGHGKVTTIRHFLSDLARGRPDADGWCYVHSFVDDLRPVALRLPSGRSIQLREAMHLFVEDLLVALPERFGSDVYGARRSAVKSRFEREARDAVESVAEDAEKDGLGLFQDADGWQLLPTDGAERMSIEHYSELSDEEQERLQSAANALEPRLDQAVRASQALARQARIALADLEREVARSVVEPRVDEMRSAFGDCPEVRVYLDAVGVDVVNHLELFATAEDGTDTGDGAVRPTDSPRARRRADARLRRYDVNVLVDQLPGVGAPVVSESHPTLANLVGRVGFEERSGVRQSDFTLIQPGALHRANGGYLVLEADELLKEPHSWDALKRALRSGHVRLEEAGDDSLQSGLVPEPIRLDVKVVVVGEPYLYFELFEHDPDFPELFKVPAEFADSMPRDEANEELYARFMATVARREGLRPLLPEAVAAVIEYSARLAEDARRLSTHFLSITDLLREADYWAGDRGVEAIHRADILSAVAARVRRADRLREEFLEDIERGILVLETDGERVGQVNAVTVVEQGDFAFGAPARVTASVRLGGGEVVDIEREVELGGPLHSKGVLILSGFLGARYAPDDPLAMAASVTFEQSYHHIDGDSASVAELVAILSALADAPVRQDLAVTGSVSQDGSVHAVGAVSTKIEGFFDVCRLGPPTSTQGVLIPAANCQHLMLRQEVVAAVEAGTFMVHPVAHIDEAIELLTELPAGVRGSDGLYPEGSFNRRVEDRLHDLAEKRKEAGHGAPSDEDDPVDHGEDPALRRRPRRPAAPPAGPTGSELAAR